MKIMREIIYKIMIVLCITFVVEEIVSEDAGGKKIKYGIGNHENILKSMFLSYFMGNNRIYEKILVLNPSIS